MTTSAGEAFQALGKTIYSAIVQFAIDSIAAALTKKLVEAFNIATEAGKAFAAAVGNALVALGVAILNIVFQIRQAQEHWETAWGTIGRSMWQTQVYLEEFGTGLWAVGQDVLGLGKVFKMTIGEMIEDMATQFQRVGLAASQTIEDAQYKLEGLYTSMADLGKSTTEKLINELDTYYDYQKLKTMSLDELLALSAETRTKIEIDGMEAVRDKREVMIEQVEDELEHLRKVEDERELSAKEEQRRKDLLIDLEKLRGEVAEESAEKEKDAAVSRLQRIEDQYKKEDELMRRKIALTEIEIKLLELKAEREAHGHSQRAKQLEKELGLMLDAYHESVEEFKKAEGEKREAIKETAKTAEEASEDIVISTKTAADEMVGAMKNATNAIIGKIGELPTRIKFDVEGKLHMPEIPEILTRYFDIFGQYHAPNIPSAQIGIPNVLRTMPVIVHKEEAILNPPQAREWRAGKGGGKGGTQVIYERGAIRMTVMGSLNQQVDIEKAMDYLAKKQAEKLRRP